MLFTTFEFLFIFLPVTLIIFKSIPRVENKIKTLCLMSLFFYSFAGPAFVLVMLATSLNDFIAGLMMNKFNEKLKRKTILIIALSINLGILAYFKYQKFFLTSIVDIVFFLKASIKWQYGIMLLDQYGGLLNLAQSNWIFANVVLPAGISFYTFESMSYSIDIYNRKLEPEKNYWRYLCFISFFPHLIAGPIVRAGQFIPQLGQNLMRRLNQEEIQAGVFLICAGLIKKVLIANTLSSPVDNLFANYDKLGMIDAWFAALGFGYQIYFDFSGYTDIAIGMAALVGITLPVNFNSPYSSRNPSDFWRRWNITLSSWFRDYLYIPMGGSRVSSWRSIRNLLLTMLLVGFWHGAAWTFILWGFYHGVLLSAYHKTVDLWNRLPAAISVALMFVLSMVGWVFFRASGLKSSLYIIGSLLGFNGVRGPDGLLMGKVMLLMIPLLTIFVQLPFPNTNEMRFQKWGIVQGFSMAILILFVIVRLHVENKFIYFVF